jgi:hypothetical protein
MTLRPKTIQTVLLAALLLTVIPSELSRAELPIDVEVAMEPGVPLAAPQEWARLLGKMDLGRVRLRSATAGEKPQVTQTESAVGARFKVVAILTSRGQLVLPDKRYRSSDRKALQDYFKDLAQQESFGEQRGRFDLTEKQFRQVHADLSRVISFSTPATTPAELLNQLEQEFKVPFFRDASSTATLQRADPIDTELRGMSAGTALAIALRKDHLALRPEKPLGEPLRIVIERQQPQRDLWPVGWKHKGSPRALAPKMFDFLTVEIDGYTLSKALEALEPRMSVAIVYDKRILAERDIQPAKIQVKLPSEKTYLKRVIDRLLVQARLAGELRVDERGRPFYWITRFGKDSPRAK